MNDRERFIVRSPPERRRTMLLALLERLKNCEVGKTYPLDATERALIIEALAEN